ncbi:unnamed protein product [Closterium sp. Yama58-4]|nr:unnamed protein product [Closterium sp. Yama58-4]
MCDGRILASELNRVYPQLSRTDVESRIGSIPYRALDIQFEISRQPEKSLDCGVYVGMYLHLHVTTNFQHLGGPIAFTTAPLRYRRDWRADMCAYISGNLLSALQTAGLTLPPQKLSRAGAMPTGGDVSEMSGVVRETSSDVQTLKKEVAALRADYAELQSKFTSVSQQLFKRVGAMEKAQDTAKTLEGPHGAHGPGDKASPSKRVDSSPDPGLRDTAASPLAGFRHASRIGADQDAAPPQQLHGEPGYAPASPSPGPALAQPHQPTVPPGRDATYYRPGTSRAAPPQRPIAPLPPAPPLSGPVYPGFSAGPPYAPPPGMPFFWQGGPPQPAPPPQQSFQPPAIPSMSAAGEGGGEWMHDAGGEVGVCGATNDGYNGGRPRNKYVGVTAQGDVWVAKLLMPPPGNPIRMGPFPSEEEAAKGYKAAALVVRPQGYRIQRSIELTPSEHQLLKGCTKQHVMSLAERGLWHRWREWRQLMPELPPAPLLQVPHAPTILPAHASTAEQQRCHTTPGHGPLTTA